VTSAGTQTPLSRAAFVRVDVWFCWQRTSAWRSNGPEEGLRLYRQMKGSDPLRRFAGACTIKLAYQAAEANHPDEGREGSPLKKIDRSMTGLTGAAKESRGRHTRRKHRPIRTEQMKPRKRGVQELALSGQKAWAFSNRCLAPEPHHSKWRHSPWGS
jgi:hypothetical protein